VLAVWQTGSPHRQVGQRGKPDSTLPLRLITLAIAAAKPMTNQG